MRVVSGVDFSPVDEIECQRVKRIRWVDPDLCLFGSSDEVHRYSLSTGKPAVL